MKTLPLTMGEGWGEGVSRINPPLEFPSKREGTKLILSIPIVRDFQPTLHFIIDIFQRSDLKPMRDAILLGKPAGVDEPLGCFLCVAQRQTEVDSRLGRRFDLREDVVALERHDRLARAGLRLLASAQT